MNYLDCAVALLAQRLPGIAVSEPRDLPVGGALPPTVIVQGAGGGLPLSAAQRRVGYTLRVYGQDSDAAVATYDALDAALQGEDGEPLGPLLVEHTDDSGPHRWWLYGAELGAPAGPEADPETRWPVLVAMATMKWATRELAIHE